MQIEDIVQIQERFRSELGAVTDLAQLDQVRRDYLGKNSGLKAALKDLRSVPEESRAQFAKLLNDTKASIEAELDAVKLRLDELSRRAQIESEWVDLSMPGIAPRRGGRHPVTEVEYLCLGVLRQLGFKLEVGPEIETEFYNFDALNIPAHHPARDMQDTFFVDGGLLLRSHTTTVQARMLEQRPPLPIKVASAGRVYRNEAVDATHLPMFHQLEGFWVETGSPSPTSRGSSLRGARSALRRGAALPLQAEVLPLHRAVARHGHRSASACSRDRLLGLPRRGVGDHHRRRHDPSERLQTFGYDPDEVSGIAFGWGTTRMASQWIGLGRIKSLYEQDLRLLRAIHGGDE